MLDLYILRKKYAAVSPLQLTISPDETQPVRNRYAVYTDALTPEPGQAAYLITDEFLFFGKIRQRQTGSSILIGPVTEYSITDEAKKRIAAYLGLRGKQAAALHSELSDIPIMKFTDFLQQLSFLNFIINEDETVLNGQTANDVAAPPIRKRSSIALDHNTAEVESKILSYIEFGKVNLLEQLFRSAQLNQATTGVIASDSLRAQKSLFITSGTLSARAAIRGGLSYDQSLSIADDYLYRLEKIYTIPGVQQLLQEMMLYFASRTAQLQIPENGSPLIKSTVQLINERLNQKICVQELAESQNVNRSYLSHQFKREMGKSLTDYIAQQKISEAIRLMDTTELNLAEIACQLGFSSQSYFHAIFKKVTGVNPGKYPQNRV